MPVLVTKWFGVFLVEKGRVERESRFPADARAIADRLLKVRRGDVLEEERQLADARPEVVEARLRGLGDYQGKPRFFDLDIEEPDGKLLHEASILVGRDESRSASAERDRFVGQSVRALDELTKTFNTLVERVREWYGLHFPEALSQLTDPEAFVDQLAKDASREALRRRAPKIAGGESIGVDFSAPQLEAIQGFAGALAALHAERGRLEKLVAAEAASVAPTLSKVVGDLLAAKLIERAGSLERLAHLPSSTVQTLGAETSLFQHIKEHTKPPKHGLLFQHGLINTAPKWQRGRLSRVLAANALLAARIDHFGEGGVTRAEAILARLEAQAKRIKSSKPRTDRPRRNGGPALRRAQPPRRAVR
ncbi:MAG: NOP58 family protein [Euryarchaeota archaeon]|nr:NOP58 family protein [Euryarchaeota archaeon]